MALITSAGAKGVLMPSVREVAPDDAPVKLERVEVRPGVLIKMSPADKAAWLERQPKAAPKPKAESKGKKA